MDKDMELQARWNVVAEGCPHQNNDGTCLHNDNMTPECTIWMCPTSFESLISKFKHVVGIIRAHYPISIFPDDGNSIDAKSAKFARSLCDAILEEANLLEEEDACPSDVQE